MARYNRTYAGERRTSFVGIQLTPAERAELEAAATQQGATLSAYSREQLLRRGGRAATTAGVRRNPEAAAIMRLLDASAYEHNAVGNNLNQIARHLNTSGDLRDWGELRDALRFYAQVAERYRAALERVLSL